MTRRQSLTWAARTSLSGCGFQPVYMPTASGKAGVAQRELAAVHVDLIPYRPGQLLRQALQDAWNELLWYGGPIQSLSLVRDFGRRHCHSAGQHRDAHS